MHQFDEMVEWNGSKSEGFHSIGPYCEMARSRCSGWRSSVNLIIRERSPAREFKCVISVSVVMDLLEKIAEIAGLTLIPVP